jgi:hypothetical protein
MPAHRFARPSRGRASVDVLQQYFRVEAIRALLDAGHVPVRTSTGWTVGTGAAQRVCTHKQLQEARRPVQEDLPE